MPFIINYPEYKEAKFETLTSIEVTKFYSSSFLDLGLAPHDKIWVNIATLLFFTFIKWSKSHSKCKQMISTSLILTDLFTFLHGNNMEKVKLQY